MNQQDQRSLNGFSPSTLSRWWRAAHPRTRTVTVIFLLLMVHWLALMALLLVARSAGAETEARLATLSWSFPRHPAVSSQATDTTQRQSQVLLAKRNAPQDDWMSNARFKDTAAPWTYDSSGRVVWK